jgi:hypothetical protein
MEGKPIPYAVAVIAALALACSGPGERHESECADHLDEDGDGLTDCMDPDCDPLEVCASDGDGDVDSDGDADADSSVDGDTSSCDLECPGPADSPLQDTCQRGDCYASGETRECCISGQTMCSTVITVGTMYESLEVDWRGLYDNDHECSGAVIESLGEMRFRWTIETRGAACEYGFIRVAVNASLDVLEVGTTYDLCDDPGLSPDGGDLVVDVYVGEGGTDQTNYTNTACETPGSFVITQVGSETGEPYEFELSGRLSEIDDAGHPTGETVDLAVESTGMITVVLE